MSGASRRVGGPAGVAALVEPGALQIQERRALGICLLLSTGNSDPNGGRTSVKFRCSAVCVLVVEKMGGRTIAPNQQLFVDEARRRSLVELGDRDVLHELQWDTQ
ncbi:hypothetical protein [Rhodococcus sp. T7]|uniref:hypothetical protein n=1 Tax=Rhodococcus sp. T7 TaxID=627444 RepID=UPI001356E80E|nr:hypothetical protein [Rhodococcus sp. T7]KAF0963442.1 hypothetical protein MLGJGCBP_03505 [Rhodococcus sp. T7]